LESRKSSLNFDFYTLNWCSNSKGVGYNPETFGTSLTGTPLVEAPYEYKLDVDRNWVSCMKTLSHSEVQSFSFFMQHNYTYTLYMDDLPSATIVRDEHDRDLPPNYFEGIPIGIFSMPSRSEHKIMIYNHLDITVLVHHTIEGHQRIVGFDVEPFSIAEGPKRGSNDPFNSDGVQYLEADQQFRFSYRIISREDK